MRAGGWCSCEFPFAVLGRASKRQQGPATVIMGANVDILSGKANWERADAEAARRCKAWSYSRAEQSSRSPPGSQLDRRDGRGRYPHVRPFSTESLRSTSTISPRPTSTALSCASGTSTPRPGIPTSDGTILRSATGVPDLQSCDGRQAPHKGGMGGSPIGISVARVLSSATATSRSAASLSPLSKAQRVVGRPGHRPELGGAPRRHRTTPRGREAPIVRVRVRW